MPQTSSAHHLSSSRPVSHSSLADTKTQHSTAFFIFCATFSLPSHHVSLSIHTTHTQDSIHLPIKKPPRPFPLDPLILTTRRASFTFLSPLSSERSRLSHQVTLLCALLSSSQVPSLSLCCRKKTCPPSLSQEVGHHGVPHTRTPDHAQGGMVSDLCMMGDVHPGGGSPPPAPTKVNSLHGTLDLIPAATRVHTMGGTMCATTEKLPSIASFSSDFFSVVFLFSASLARMHHSLTSKKLRGHPNLSSTSSEP